MEGLGELGVALIKALGMSLGMGAIVIFVFLVITLFMVRRQVQGRMWLYFVEPNGLISGKLFKPEAQTVSAPDARGNNTHYTVNPDKQYWIAYPPGWPKIVQEPAKAQIHIRGVAEPIDARGLASDISGEIMAGIQDIATIREVTQAAEKASGVKPKALQGGWLTILLILIAAVGAIVAAYFSYSQSAQLDEILRILGG